MDPATCRYLLDITDMSGIEDLWDAHTRRMALFGFDRLIYGFTRYFTPTSLGNPDDFLILSNHEPAFIDKFIGDGLYRHSPMLHWARENEGACSWRLLTDMIEGDTLTDAEKRVIAFNAELGVTAGYTLSFKSVSARSRGAIALTGRRDMTQDQVDAVWAKHGADITLMNNVAHLKILTLPHIGSGKPLTKRQREALEWVGDGKTMQDIATIMGLTTATIEKHLRLAREALNVDTTAQAVMKAAFQNQMFIIEV